MILSALNLPLAPKYIAKPLLVIALLLVCQYLIPNGPQVLALDFNLANAGETWRFFTGNLVHSGDVHLLFNCLGVFLVWLLYAEAYDSKRYLITIVAGCFAVGFGENYLSNYDQYVGFSGVLHGLLLFGAITDIKNKHSFGWIVFIIIAGKIAIENTTNMSIFAGAVIDDNVAVTSHLLGGIAGVVVGVLMPPNKD